jgi:hypothetical protein
MKLSAHFGSEEFRCHCGACGEPLVSPELVENLESWRALLNADLAPGEKEHVLKITSGCRCTTWNKQQGGKAGSQHLYNPHVGLMGRAADVYSPTRSLREVYLAAIHIPGFKGIGLAPPVEADSAKGRKGRAGYVHVDVRPSGTVARWGYSDDGATVALATVLPKLGIEV